MIRKVPVLRTDEEAERFLEGDLSEYLQAQNLQPVRFELVSKSDAVSVALTDDLFQEVKAAAEQEGVSYQTFITRAVQDAVTRSLQRSR